MYYERKPPYYDWVPVALVHTWWSKDLPFRFPKALVSAYYLREKRRLTEDIDECRDDYLELWLDSGGFQNFSYGANFTFFELKNLQAKYADIAFTLDKPIRRGDSPSVVEKKIEYNVNNAIDNLLWRNDEGYKFKLYFCVHTSDKVATLHKYEKIYSKITDEYGVKFDGVAVGIHSTGSPNDVFNIMTTFVNLFSQHTNMLHLLGLCGVNYLMYMICLAYERGVVITSDWSFVNHKRLRYIVPHTLTKAPRIPERVICDCPACQYLKLKGATYKGNARYVLMHDIYWTDMLIRNWRAVAEYDMDTYVDVYVKMYAKRLYDYLRGSKAKTRRGLDEW